MKSRFLSSSRLYDFNALSGRRRRTNQNARTVAPPTATPLRSIGVVFLFFSFVFVVLILLSFWLLPSPHLPSVAWPTDALLISSFSIGSFGSRRGQIGRAPIGNNSNNSNNNNNNMEPRCPPTPRRRTVGGRRHLCDQSGDNGKPVGENIGPTSRTQWVGGLGGSTHPP